MQLAWRKATADDRPALQRFTCTRRERRNKRTVYPRGWERIAESAVRTVNPECDERSTVLVGVDSAGIAAVVSVGLLEDEEASYYIELIAVEMRHRNNGGAVADAALDEAVQWVVNHGDAAGYAEVEIFAELDPRNAASRALLSRYGFTLFAKFQRSEAWSYKPPPIMLF